MIWVFFILVKTLLMHKNLSRYLISFSTLWYGIIPVIADLSESHLHNTNWTPHSKFHLAWLLSTGTLISIYSMYLMWYKNSTIQAAVNGLCIMGGFWIAAIFKSSYGGMYADKSFDEASILGLNPNVFAFIFVTLFLTIGLLIELKKNNHQ